jgi:hypothetical protein
MRKFRTFIYSATAVLTALMVGCGGHVQQADQIQEPEFPAALQQLQGAWKLTHTNEISECAMIVVGHTMRFRFKADESASLLKRNMAIQRVDVQQRILVFEGTGGAWPYELNGDSSSPELRLEFYNPTTHQWRKVDLCKTRTL